MRILELDQLTLTSQAGPTLTYHGARGARLTLDVLDHDLIRVRMEPDGAPRLDRTWLVVGPDGDTPREGRSRADLSPFACPDYTFQQDGDLHTLQTDRLRLTIHPNRPHIEWADSTGRRFAADLAAHAYAYDGRGQTVWHFLERDFDEHYYGFGEKAGPLDKHGQRLRMLNLNTFYYDAETSDPLYKHWPFYITYVPELDIAYGLFYDNLATSLFDLGREINGLWGPHRYYQADGGDLDYTLIYGPTIPEVIAKFARLTGLPYLPPRWSLGYWGSTMHYTEAPDAQAQLKRFIDLCQQHNIPCDGFHLSSGYTTDDQGRRNVFQWNRSKLPDPQAMIADFHAAGMHLSANIKPFLLRTNPGYPEVEARGGFIHNTEGDAPEPVKSWSGGLYDAESAAYVDFTSAAGFDWWQEKATAALLEYGIDTLWNDNNEFEVWDDEARCDGFGQSIPAGLIRPLHTLLMGRASFEATRRHQPDRRPYVVTRAGVPGIQRYAQTWSGDNVASWHTLRWNQPMGLGLSLSGFPNTGHDVGGFCGDPPSPELLLRWIQVGIFFPRFTIHSVGESGQATEPWMYPDILPLIREAIRFRYRLIPYLYTLLFESTQTGQPIMRPLVYAFPRDPHCRTESFDFLLGPNLLIAPIMEPKQRSRAVYLPAGTEWCDLHTGQWHAGGQTIEAAAPLERIPLFAPAGGLIPLGKAMQHVGAEPDDQREVLAFPHPDAGSGTFTLIEDDGVSTQLDYTKVILQMDATPEAIHLAVEVEGSYPLPYQAITFILPPGEARPVQAAEATESTGTDGQRRITLPLA